MECVAGHDGTRADGCRRALPASRRGWKARAELEPIGAMSRTDRGDARFRWCQWHDFLDTGAHMLGDTHRYGDSPANRRRTDPRASRSHLPGRLEHEVPVSVAFLSVLALVLVACSSSGASSAPSAAVSVAPPSVAPSVAAIRGGVSVGGRQGRADHLRRRLPEGRARRGQARLRGGQPGRDAAHLDRRLVRRSRRKIEQGAPARRLPVGRHDEPAEARRQGADRPGRPSNFAGNKLTVIVPIANPARHRPRPKDLAKPGVKIIAAGRCGADHEVRQPAGRQPGQAAGLSGGLRRRPITRTSCPRRTTSRRSWPSSSSRRG